MEEKKDGCDEKIGVTVSEAFTDDSATESRGSSSSRFSSDCSCDEVKKNSRGSSSPLSSCTGALGWPIRKSSIVQHPLVVVDHDDDSKLRKSGRKVSETDMMERFSKLLLGEDMSGSGKGVCTALALSNAITNLSATVFGQIWRLEPLPIEKKVMWRREMEWLLCVCDHIVELFPSWQTYPDGSKLEVMDCRARSDLFINLPALRKLDNMLLEILDSFINTEFWYVDKGIVASNGDGSAASRRLLIQRQEDKWWLPVPRIPPGGLSDKLRKQLGHKRECTNQILKAVMAINSITLADMEVPESFLESLPKNGRSCLGDVIYRYITSEQFSSETLLDCLDLSNEHVALEMANRVETAIYVWRRRNHPKPPTAPTPNRATTKSSWGMMKDFVLDGVDKREVLAQRAESLLLCLKQRFPGLTQTSLDTSKIQFNKDVGKSILESYSRVLESLAFNIVARIDDLIYVDDITKHSDRVSSVSSSHKRVSVPYSVSLSGTPYKTDRTSPAVQLISPAGGYDRTPFIRHNVSNKPPRRGLGVKRALTNYLGVSAVSTERSGSDLSSNVQVAASRVSIEGSDRNK